MVGELDQLLRERRFVDLYRVVMPDCWVWNVGRRGKFDRTLKRDCAEEKQKDRRRETI
jgi:hypothetical protein